MDIWGWIGAIIIGGIAGWLAGKVMRGGGFGVLINVLIGIAGVYAGQLVDQHSAILLVHAKLGRDRIDPDRLYRRRHYPGDCRAVQAQLATVRLNWILRGCLNIANSDAKAQRRGDLQRGNNKECKHFFCTSASKKGNFQTDSEAAEHIRCLFFL
jgi:uncharacterized membrane protein YeaQ/YmgE (transglycosylase-associated protein family)